MRIPFQSIPNMPMCSVAGHGSDVELRDVDGQSAMVFTGRFHGYEGHADEVTLLPACVAALMGVRYFLLTNAVGSLHSAYTVGSLVAISDIIDATGTGMQLRNGSRFVEVLDKPFTETIIQKALAARVALQRGTYVQVSGPSYETRAEIRMYRRMGAHMIGMSTAREALWASSIGLRTAAISLITNSTSDTLRHSVQHADVIATASASAHAVGIVLQGAVQAMTDTPT